MKCSACGNDNQPNIICIGDSSYYVCADEKLCKERIKKFLDRNS